MEQEWEIGEEDWAIGDLQAPGGGTELPPLLDQPTAPPPTPPTPPRGVSVVEGYATAAAAAIIRNKRGRVVASSKAIEGLREVTAPPTDDCCAVCLQDFDSRPDPAETTPPSEVRLRAMPCSHNFHEHCIFEWLRRNAACPLCRHQLPMEEEELDPEQQRREEHEAYMRETLARWYAMAASSRSTS